ncbi:hypothetical protein Dimus_002616 [Dionaea muscipula]
MAPPLITDACFCNILSRPDAMQRVRSSMYKKLIKQPLMEPYLDIRMQLLDSINLQLLIPEDANKSRSLNHLAKEESTYHREYHQIGILIVLRITAYIFHI